MRVNNIQLPKSGLLFDGKGRPTNNIGKFFPIFYAYTHEHDSLVDFIEHSRECAMNICAECAAKEVYDYGRDPDFLQPLVNHSDWDLHCGHCHEPIPDSESLVMQSLHREQRPSRKRMAAIKALMHDSAIAYGVDDED
jgi:hypothetical protein